MAEFDVVCKEFRRMCWHYQRECRCKDCPLRGSNIGQCRKNAFASPHVFEYHVMQWAAEHPEPVYPTWGDYLTMLMLEDITHSGDTTPQTLGQWMCKNRIPADIAKKLGIQPEEVKL